MHFLSLLLFFTSEGIDFGLSFALQGIFWSIFRLAFFCDFVLYEVQRVEEEWCSFVKSLTPFVFIDLTAFFDWAEMVFCTACGRRMMFFRQISYPLHFYRFDGLFWLGGNGFCLVLGFLGQHHALWGKTVCVWWTMPPPPPAGGNVSCGHGYFHRHSLRAVYFDIARCTKTQLFKISPFTCKEKSIFQPEIIPCVCNHQAAVVGQSTPLDMMILTRKEQAA